MITDFVLTDDLLCLQYPDKVLNISLNHGLLNGEPRATWLPKARVTKQYEKLSFIYSDKEEPFTAKYEDVLEGLIEFIKLLNKRFE